MRSTTKRLIRFWGVVLLAGMAVFGCHNKGSDNNAAVRLSGTVSQGAVSGAIVFADHLTGPEANYKMDPDEAATSTTTDENGKYTLPATPAYDHVMVSRGGTDRIFQTTAMQMAAMSDATNITPLTTMVALTQAGDRQALKDTIQSLGIPFDADLSASVTPAAAFLVQSVQTAIAVLTDTLNPGDNTLPTTMINAIQRTIVARIASQIKGKTADQLTNASDLTLALTAAFTDAINEIVLENSNITLASGASAGHMAATIASTCVNIVAQAITASTGSASFSTAATWPEHELVSATSANTINIVYENLVADISNQVVVTAPSNSLPTISGKPSSSVIAGTLYSFTPAATDADNDELTFIIANMPAWASFSPATGLLSGRPAAADAGSTTSNIVISVTDGHGPPISLPAFSITVVSPTGTTGSTGGS